ncbi:3'-5' exoribonuclease domain-containing protein [Streptomyces sp. NPDC088252]|uniref:3'-5' exoribonuclease domain-containing protein n=1 Tax=Streptomyces sp. NPDC088252 TaxID=3365845 RepID=UPI0037F67E24
MRIFYDTEFREDGRLIDLISIGMVRDDGTQYYAINRECDWHEVVRHDWLRKHVVPYLPIRFPSESSNIWIWDETHHDYEALRTRKQIAHEVRRFITDTPKAELWAWYGAYDHVTLAQLYGPMINLPSGIPMWTNDLRQETARLGDPPLPPQMSCEHNALDDALYLRSCAQELDALEAA